MRGSVKLRTRSVRSSDEGGGGIRFAPVYAMSRDENHCRPSLGLVLPGDVCTPALVAQ